MASTTEATIRFPYRRSLGPVMGAFMTALTEQKLLGIRSGDRVIVPPREWDPDTAAELSADDLVEVGPAGTVETWTWVPKPTSQHPLDTPFAWALVKLDGAATSILHAVDAGSESAMSIGMRVAPRWKAERVGHITDFVFIPGETAETNDGPSAAEPVTMMDYNATITYTTPVPDNLVRYEQATGEGKLLGLKCSGCGRLYTAGKGFCPIDSIELTEADEVVLPETGVITNYTIITPTPYPGQTETEPFARVHVLLDGADIVLGYQGMVDTPNDQVHVGLRVAAVWASPAERNPNDPMSNFVGWVPTGKPDDTNPELVNRLN